MNTKARSWKHFSIAQKRRAEVDAFYSNSRLERCISKDDVEKLGQFSTGRVVGVGNRYSKQMAVVAAATISFRSYCFYPFNASNHIGLHILHLLQRGGEFHRLFEADFPGQSTSLCFTVSFENVVDPKPFRMLLWLALHDYDCCI